MRHRATSHNNCHASDHEDRSDNDDADYVPGNSSVGDSESDAGSLGTMEQHWDDDASQSSNGNEDGGVDSPSGNEEEGSKEEEKEEKENDGDDELEVHDHHVNCGLQLGDSFGLSKMAVTWQMFKSNSLQTSLPVSLLLPGELCCFQILANLTFWNRVREHLMVLVDVCQAQKLILVVCPVAN